MYFCRNYRNPFQWAWLLLLATCLAACSAPVTQLQPLASDDVILAFGDSITHGNGATAANSYPAVLSQLTGRRVINAGVPGEVSAAGARRLPALLDRHRPALLILCHGGNDMLRKLDSTAMYDNLATMVAAAHARGIAVVLLGVPQPGLFLLDSAEAYDRLASAHGLAYDGDILPEVYSDKALKADQIHPNADGYRRIAQAVLQLLQDSGALPRS